MSFKRKLVAGTAVFLLAGGATGVAIAASGHGRSLPPAPHQLRLTSTSRAGFLKAAAQYLGTNVATLRRETKGQGHEVAVRCGGGHRFLRVTRDRLRGRGTDFVFVVFIVAFFGFARDPETLGMGWELLDPASANAAWAAASRAMGTR